MRPVLRRNGRSIFVALRINGCSGATKRAFPSLPKNPPSKKNRSDPPISPRRCGHNVGASTSNPSSDKRLNAPISKSRLPSFSNADSAACSRKIAAGEEKSNADPKPSRLATSQTIHQSGFASPGGGRNARWREIRRSELVTVPDFSPQASAGNSTCAPELIVSFDTTLSEIRSEEHTSELQS